MISGYQRELSYKRSDGSYSAFGNGDKEGNTWYVAFNICFYLQLVIVVESENPLL